jgi:hypothetical protein
VIKFIGGRDMLLVRCKSLIVAKLEVEPACHTNDELMNDQEFDYEV